VHRGSRFGVKTDSYASIRNASCCTVAPGGKEFSFLLGTICAGGAQRISADYFRSFMELIRIILIVNVLILIYNNNNNWKYQ
jgi:hypothetical protein